jgi:hypothetical protein
MDKKPAYGDNDAFNENVATLRACLDKTIADLHDLVFHPDNEIPERFEDDEVEETVIPCELRHEMPQRRHGTSHNPDPEDIWNNPELDPRTLPEARKTQPRDTIFEEHYASFDDKPLEEEPVIPCAQKENKQHAVMRRRCGTSSGTRKRKQTRQQKITAHYTRLEKQLKLILAAQKSALAQAELEQQKTDTDNKAVNDAKAKEEAEATEYLLGVFERVGKRMAEESKDQYIQGGPGVYEKLMNMHKRE